MPSQSTTDTHPPPFVLNVSAEMLDYLPHALGVLALDGTIRAVNRAALKLLNFHSSEVIGRHFSSFLRSLDPPLLAGGFQTLLELGNATFDVALRSGGDRFVQVEIQLVVIFDGQAQPSSVLVLSSEGDAENFLLRQAAAKVADQVSRMIAYDSANQSLWPKLFALCRELFETPGGWLLLHDEHKRQRIPFLFGLLQGQFDKPRNGVTIHNCPCTKLDANKGEPCAANSMDCPWFVSAPDCTGAEALPRHHAVVPILNAVGAHVADICLLAPADRIFHRHELMLMDAISDQIGQALERGEIHLPAQIDNLDRHSLSSGDNPSPELVELFEQILDNLAALVPFVSAGVFLQEREDLRLMAAVNHPQAQALRGQLFPVANNLLNQEIVRTRSLLILEDVRQDSRFQLWGGLDYIRSWMGLPLVVNDAVIGIVTVDSDRVGGFSQRDGEVAQAFANQAAIAVEKAQLAAELRLQKANLELLYQISQKLAATLEPQEVAEKALKLITEALGNCFGEIYVAESGQELLQLLATQNHAPPVVEKLPNQPYLRIGVGITGGAVELRRPILVPNVHDDPRWFPIPDVDVEIQSMAAIPLIARDQVVGVMVLGSEENDVITYDHLPLFQSIAAPVALALQNARLFAAERRRRQEADILRNAVSAVMLDLPLEQILRILLERLGQVVHFDSACVLLVDGDELRPLAQIGLPNPEEVMGKSLPSADSFLAEIRRKQGAVVFHDVQKLSRFLGWGGTGNVRGWMGVPLLHRGELLGYITLDSLQAGSYGDEEAYLAQAFADQIAINIINAHLIHESQQAAIRQEEISGMLRGLNSAISFTEIQAAVAGGLHRLINPDAVEIALYQPDEKQVNAGRSQWAKSDDSVSMSAHTYALDESAAVQSILSGQIHMSPDVAKESHWSAEMEWAEQGYRSQMVLPLLGSDRVLGHIRILWKDRFPANLTIDFSLRQVADGVAMAAERLNLLLQTMRRADELQVLTQLSGQLRPLERRSDITRLTLDICCQLFQADRGYVFVPTNDGETLILIDHVGMAPLSPIRILNISDSINGHVFTTGLPYYSPNLYEDPLASKSTVNVWFDKGARFASAVYAPLRAGDQIIGVISLAYVETKRSFTQTDLRLLNAMADIAGNALHRSAILEGLEQRVEARTADLARANAKLLELDKMKSDFVANVSHELRTPLTNIKLYLDLLGRGRLERREHYLQVITGETEKLQALIESILDFSALEKDQAEMVANFAVVVLNDLMETVFHTFHDRAAAAQIDLIYLPAAQPVHVWGDRDRLFQIAENLLSNAISYTKPGGKVELSLTQNALNEVGIVVRDMGIGIPPHEIEHIFDHFYRSERVNQSDILGAGLGLSIANKIAQTHGGRIEVDSVLDVGTTFTVWFSAIATV